MSDPIKYTQAYWRERLSDIEYNICREKGTEAPFTGKYWDVFDRGYYVCRGCSQSLFKSEDKFDAGCGWPSFSAPESEAVIKESFDESHGMRRTEVLCQKCSCHLGHVFTDGPKPSSLRYCINSASITLNKA